MPASPANATHLPPRRPPLDDLVRVYGYYRLLLGGLLLLLFLLDAKDPLYGAYKPGIYMTTCAAYLAVSLALIMWNWLQPGASRLGTLASIVADICALTILAHASGGLQSGISMLLAVAVAAASVTLNQRLALLVAALATIAILIETGVRALLGHDRGANFYAASLLGILFFATAFAIRQLADRISASQRMVQQSAEDIARLQALNEIIVQRLRTGIVVLTPGGQARLTNASARQMLALDASAGVLPDGLLERWQRWREAPADSLPPLRAGEHEIQASFTRLQGQDGDTLAFLEDTRQLHQRAQQIKLASLGRLTASIAHEIRNPLGAIAHAAQLLLESPGLAAPDRRLGDIIISHSKRMNGVIESVLSLSRRSASRPEQLALAGWLKNFCDEYAPIFPANSHIDLDIAPASLAVSFDPGQLGQVLTNLCQNGLRYSERHTGRPTLLLRARPTQNGERIDLDIIDDGPGIAQECVPNLFEPFFTTEPQGTGLGLYIARELCEANQARLDYRRDDGRSCFRISFSHPERRPLPAS